MTWLLRIVTSWAVPILILIFVLHVISGEPLINNSQVFILTMILLMLGAQFSIQKGYVKTTTAVILLTAWIGITYSAIGGDGLFDSALYGYLGVLLAAGFLLDRRLSLLFGLLSIVSFWTIALLRPWGELPISPGIDRIAYARDLSLNFLVISLVLNFIITSLHKSLKKSESDVVSHVQSEAELKEQAVYLNALHETTLGIINRLELHPLLELIVMRALELVDAPGGLIELVLKDESAMQMEVGIGLPEARVGRLTEKHVGLTGTVWATGKTLMVESYIGWEFRDPTVKDKLQATVGVPLITKDKLIGVLAVMHTDKGKSFSSEQIALLERFSSLASLAIQNARLYEDVQKELLERRLVQGAMRDSEEKFRIVFESSPIAICITAFEDGRLLEANYSYWDLMGYTPEDAIGKTSEELSLWSAPSERKNFIEELKRKGSVNYPDDSFLDESGKIRHVISFYRLVNIGGKQRILSMFYDLSEQKQTLEALRQSEERTHALLQAIPDMLIELTIDGLIINMLPPKGIAGPSTRAQYLGRKLVDVFDEKVSSVILPEVREAIESNEIRIIEFDMDVDNSRRVMEGRLVANSQTSTIIMIRDVTQRKWDEDEREQLINELRMRNRESETLREGLSSIVSTFDLNEVLERILDQIKNVIPYDTSSVWRFEENIQKLIVGRDLPSEITYESTQFPLDETNISMPVITGAQPYILNNDVKKNLPRFREHPHDYINSWLSVPLKIKGNIIGLIQLDGKEMGQFTEHHAELAVTFANQVAIALENARLFSNVTNELEERKVLIRELEAKNAEAETLREGTTIVASSLEISETVKRILEQIQRVVNYDSASVWLYHEKEAVMIGSRNLPFGIEKPGFYVPSANEPDYPFFVDPDTTYIVIEDLQENYPQFRNELQNYIRGWMAISMRARGKLIGFIALDSKKVGGFIDADARIALAFADQVSIALENARLLSDLQLELSNRKKLIAELESKNAELERFTYTVSHDLKSPLFTIRGFLGYLEKDALSGNIDRMYSDMKRITDATDRMHLLLNELLEISRIGRVEHTKENVSFEELAREAVELVQGRIMEKGIAIHIDADLPDVYVDRRRLIEVLQNLVDNAAKFTSDRPDPRIDIGVKDRDEVPVVFYVRDNGIGIPIEQHERIFGLFNKLDPSGEGTGIGLSLVKRIIEVHEGTIWVESNPGEGAAFYFTLGS